MKINQNGSKYFVFSAQLSEENIQRLAKIREEKRLTWNETIELILNEHDRVN